MTKKYFVYDGGGMIIATAFLEPEDAALQTNMTDIEPPLDIGKVPWFIKEEGRWESRDPVVIDNTAIELRTRMYPPVGEQLDMLWHAMNRGEIPKAQGWFDAIKSIKDEVPRDEPVFEVGAMPEA